MQLPPGLCFTIFATSWQPAQSPLEEAATWSGEGVRRGASTADWTEHAAIADATAIIMTNLNIEPLSRSTARKLRFIFVYYFGSD
jgi:hypothetical protein